MTTNDFNSQLSCSLPHLKLSVSNNLTPFQSLNFVSLENCTYFLSWSFRSRYPSYAMHCALCLQRRGWEIWRDISKIFSLSFSHLTSRSSLRYQMSGGDQVRSARSYTFMRSHAHLSDHRNFQEGNWNCNWKNWYPTRAGAIRHCRIRPATSDRDWFWPLLIAIQADRVSAFHFIRFHMLQLIARWSLIVPGLHRSSDRVSAIRALMSFSIFEASTLFEF